MDVWIALATILAVVLVIWLSCRSAEQLNPSGRAVFISGCDTGIGQRLAIHFSGLGCEVFAGCLDPEKAKSGLPDGVHAVPLDVTNEESVTKAVEAVKERLEQNKKDLWALVNNAGVCVCGFFEWQTWLQCERQVQVNLLGTMRITKACLPLLRKMKGRLITISSINGSISYPGLSVYCATKHALEGLHDSLRVELGLQHGIRAILVQPGDYARATAIMSQHDRNASDMWEGMAQQDRDGSNGDLFKKYHRQTRKNYGLTSPGSLDGADVVKDVEDAVLGLCPKDRYVSASKVMKLVYKVLAICPTKVSDALLGKVVRVMMNSDDKEED
ncbi:hypothetical protein JTE90_010796 [Oedothorax gibbosus]|uniref:D-beta-hydroxybutyrate dehydrogenase, mitochondrial n=1 Tax=Oedothorax gibbosus TaxID=931172 RepID=A0AAV6VFL3_9ARAC|nr:hypothetical protein JTE90_010796 [Oedothorax gibbosus]